MQSVVIALFLTLLATICFCQEVKDRYYPRYHFAPPNGWMNDPNGFSKYLGEYHLFYQHNPKTSLDPGYAHWGHAKSKDLLNWEHLPIALYPDEDYDINGVFSGSAIVEDNMMYIFYTGHVNFEPDGNNNMIDHKEQQCLALSDDGVHFQKYEKNPVIKGENLQPNIRDPKVWKHDDNYYMVAGNSVNNTLGRILLFKSTDRTSWAEVSVLLESDGPLGYMFECPDFFELDGKFVLLFSPQGIEPIGDQYKNLFQTVYIIGSFSYETYIFKPETDIQELDHGHDFYATQTFDDEDRRLMLAWMSTWEKMYPERNDGFAGIMTIPRELTLDASNRLIQTPIAEIVNATSKLLYMGSMNNDKYVVLDNKTSDIYISGPSNEDVLIKIGTENSDYGKVLISFDAQKGQVTLNRNDDDGIRRTTWKPVGPLLVWRILVDASSIELFCGRGEVTFSSRFFPDGPITVSAKGSESASITIFSLQHNM